MSFQPDFAGAADAVLDSLYTRLAEASDRFDFDVDMNEGALVIEFEAPRERFVISPNSAANQIWVSANVHSYKFDCTPEGFTLPSGQALDDLIAEAIRRRIPDFEY